MNAILSSTRSLTSAKKDSQTRIPYWKSAYARSTQNILHTCGTSMYVINQYDIYSFIIINFCLCFIDSYQILGIGVAKAMHILVLSLHLIITIRIMNDNRTLHTICTFHTNMAVPVMRPFILSNKLICLCL